ncbi:porin family protein [Rapidithrix thailandica]|uniref:Porin family protein n=1 Tax=Rapidithrix thailandica TaxID=413964 RepID=A0AAW9RNV4_9BACT
MTKLSTIILVLLGISLTSLAQKKLEKGVVYTINGDSIQGQIDYKNWDQNPEKFTFQTSNGVKTKYDLTTAKGFKVFRSDGFSEVYERAIVEVETSPYRIPYSFSPELDYQLDTVFLQVLALGKVNLYYLKDKEGKEHLFASKVEESSKPTELILKKYYNSDPSDGQKNIATISKYRNQLTALTIDCKDISMATINRLPYKKGAITKLVEKYNQCGNKESQNAYTFQKQKLKPQIWLNAGLTSTELSFEGKSSNKIEKADFDQNYSWVAGIGLNFYIPRTKQRLAIYPELLLRSYSTEGFYKDQIYNEENHTNYNYSFDLLYLKLNALVKLRLKPEGFTPFIIGGVSGAYALKDDNTLVKENVTYSTKQVYNSPAIKDFRSFEQAWVVGFGLEGNRLGVEFRYENSNGMVDYVELDSSVKTLYLVTRVRLGKKN